jgi:endonuclease-8
MPEGDTVWRTARRLDQALSGRPLTESDFRVPRWAHLDLVGQTVAETVSRGKHILTRLPKVTVHTHLKMEGSWHVYRPTSRWREPVHRARLILGNADWRAVGFQLGTVEVVERDAEHTVVGHLGPDILGDDWSLDEATRRLAGDQPRPIVEALLDQRNIAGVGNVWKSEGCFLAGLSPWRPIETVTDEQVMRAIREMRPLMMRSVEQGGKQRRWVFERSGRPCRRCSTLIRFRGQGDDNRNTFWCPECQR